MRIAVSRLADRANIDDMSTTRSKLKEIVPQRGNLKFFFIIVNEHQAVGMPRKGDIKLSRRKEFSNFR